MSTPVISSWLSPPTAARELGIEPAKVIAWIAAGQLTAVNIAERTGPRHRARWRIRRTDWEKFLRDRQNVKPAPAPAHRQRSSRPEQPYY